MNELLVIVPAHNEEKNIGKVVSELRTTLQHSDILIINDGSTDNTENELRKLQVAYMNTPYNFGYAGVLQTGFKYALKNGYTYAAQFDGDGQHIASELNRMYEEMRKEKIDILIGSRFLEKKNYHHPLMRMIGTYIFRILILITCRKKITDPTSGLQILSWRVFSHYSLMNSYPEYPDANLITEMVFLGFTLKEIPVVMREREFGESMHAGTYKAFSYMVKMLYSIVLMFVKYRSKRPGRIDKDSPT
jgi:glycosyltransferase involved in cell wall biosynthesis